MKTEQNSAPAEIVLNRWNQAVDDGSRARES